LAGAKLYKDEIFMHHVAIIATLAAATPGLLHAQTYPSKNRARRRTVAAGRAGGHRRPHRVPENFREYRTANRRTLSRRL